MFSNMFRFPARTLRAVVSQSAWAGVMKTAESGLLRDVSSCTCEERERTQAPASATAVRSSTEQRTKNAAPPGGGARV